MVSAPCPSAEPPPRTVTCGGVFSTHHQGGGPTPHHNQGRLTMTDTTHGTCIASRPAGDGPMYVQWTCCLPVGHDGPHNDEDTNARFLMPGEVGQAIQVDTFTTPLLDAAKVMHKLGDDIAELLSVAADDADVVITTYTERTGSADKMLANELVQRLVYDGWSFTHTEVDD